MPTAPRPLPSKRISKSWWKHHAVWKIALGLLILLLLCALGAAPTLLKMSSIHRSDVYQEVMAQAARHPELREQLGEPIRAAWFVSGELQKDTLAKLSIPVSGPKGKGTIQVVATKSFGVWWFYTLKAEVEGQSSPIDLLVIKPAQPADSQ